MRVIFQFYHFHYLLLSYFQFLSYFHNLILVCDFWRDLNLSEMTIGVLEVNLVDARGLTKTDFLNKIDPYVLIQYKNQEHKSNIANGEGSSPKWNEKFTFRVEYPEAEHQPKLLLKIMDHDTFSDDDYIGQTMIYLKELLEQGVENGIAELHPHKYNVVNSSQSYSGEIRVGLTFTPEEETETYDDEEFGGWKESQW